jgi:LysR family transcriptional regulator, transcription activator of glutamate synthase operon
MEIKQVRYFLAIVEGGSFSSAADGLYISQSSLSKQMIALEKELGCQLFDRSKRKIALTEAGRIFSRHAGPLYDNYKRLLSDLVEFSSETTLSIASIPVIAQYGITDYIARFRSAYPGVPLVLEEREGATILPALNDEQYDLAFVRDNYLDAEQYGWVKIFSDQMVVLVSRNHPLSQRTQLSLTELANENFILFDKGTVVHELSVAACRQVGFEPRVFYASLRVESILSLVASNVGIALMMRRISDYHRHPEIVSIPLVETISSNLVIAYLKNKKPSWSARNFIDLIQGQLSKTESPAEPGSRIA